MLGHLGMIPLTNHDSRAPSRREVVMKFTQSYVNSKSDGKDSRLKQCTATLAACMASEYLCRASVGSGGWKRICQECCSMLLLNGWSWTFHLKNHALHRARCLPGIHQRFDDVFILNMFFFANQVQFWRLKIPRKLVDFTICIGSVLKKKDQLLAVLGELLGPLWPHGFVWK